MKTKFRKRFPILTSLAILLLVFVIVMAIVPSLLTDYDPLAIDPANRLQKAGDGHFIGTDEYGRDLWSRVVYGARNTILVGLGSALLAALIGIPLGLIAGYFGKFVDSAIMRVLDAFLAFPMVLLAILIITIFEPSAWSLIITIGVVSFPRFARIVRGNVLSLKTREFVEANKAFGAPRLYIMFRTILPNCISSITVQFSLLVVTAIIIEAGMSFLGLGIAPPAPAWGSMLAYAQTYIGDVPMYTIAPGVMIFLIVISINIIGDALRDWFDPVKK